MVVASVVCVEFINMMAAIDRLAEAAHMLAYLAAANDFGALAARTLVAEAAAQDRWIHTADATGRRRPASTTARPSPTCVTSSTT